MEIIAEKLKFKRKELKLTQQELAEGICEQSQVSKIERKIFIPGADLLFKLSQRLGVTVDYFFNENFSETSSLIDFKRISQRLLEDRNYVDLEYFYHLEIEKNSYLTEYDKAYLVWIHSLILFYRNNNQDKAIAQLEAAITKLNNQSELFLLSLNTLSNFYSLLGKDEKYEQNYRRLLHIYENTDFDNQKNLFVYIKVQYNYAHYLHSVKNRNMEAIEIALETIEYCKKHRTVYQLAPLLTILGNAGQHIMDKNEIKNYYIEARELCKIFDNKLMYIKINDYINELDKIEP
ncbi:MULTISPECIES: helix-turn-helix domain-containing protein [unclassified Streptococcus]|uniref:helix-turn-helix domain-containing protein n=1 Tax=unclassified Streptococcus TaxID=2608887 RepID=UPI0010729042|nr:MULTISPECIES: helix-turn-helix transcriptional regulator [unclassified Streptococcus]MBF0786905.1 helix-turn-helix transcriptional regulator [Streptococcus sp. 19428wC2_LYSM12]MCQ9212683.1 helix-turn-helix domain-containing protein [Streptococcus sp. B01]MCQ9214024.1 helix-turn-helix domain-containing protein [Streptococcus sp. O1]TFV06273.1 XRE family transcriptional regulator [Streptococcus sp. LYSM12]